MAEDSDYDIIPHAELIKLRREVNELKQHPLGTTSTGKELLETIKELNTNISNLFNLFKEAAEEMKLEESEAKMVAEKMKPMMQKFDTLIDQNEKIAKGIVAVADMVKDDVKKKLRPLPFRMSVPPQREDPEFAVPSLNQGGRPIPLFDSMSSSMGAPSNAPSSMNAPQMSRPMPSSPARFSVPPAGPPGSSYDRNLQQSLPPNAPGPEHSESLPPFPPHAPEKKHHLFG